MTQTEDLVRSTTQALAGTVRAVRPLAPLPQAPWPDEVTRGRGRRRAGWLAPLAAAAAMTLVVAGLVVARAVASGPGRAQAPPAAPAIPEYYVMLHQTSGTSVASLVVGNTRTGKQVAAVPAPAGGTFIGVTGAADDRTFVVDAAHGRLGFGDGNPHDVAAAAGPRTWYLLRIFPGSAQPVRLTPLPIPATAEQTVVVGIALSPDGTRLAVALRADEPNDTVGPAELRVYSVATGRMLRSWTAPAGSTVIPWVSVGVDSDTSLRWLDDGHTLALESTSASGNDIDTTIRTLDVSRPGTSLITSSQVVWSSGSPYSYTIGGPAPCRSNGLVLLSGDGKTVVCSRIVPASDPASLPNQRCTPGTLPGTVELAEFSVATKRLLRALAAYPSSCATGAGVEAYPLWASTAGTEVIGYLNTVAYTVTGQQVPGVIRFGVFGAGAFRPLPYPSLPSGVALPERIAW